MPGCTLPCLAVRRQFGWQRPVRPQPGSHLMSRPVDRVGYGIRYFSPQANGFPQPLHRQYQPALCRQGAVQSTRSWVRISAPPIRHTGARCQPVASALRRSLVRFAPRRWDAPVALKGP